MEPAPIEHVSILGAKSGADVEREIYAFKDKGGRDVGLRFDLTVGMTRYACSRRDLKPPVKLAALAGVWRYDEPQHARYRWFRQWDLEIFGPRSVGADAEVIEATSRLFEKLGLKGFKVSVGDRRVVEEFITRNLGVATQRAPELMRALDKAQKRSLPELKSEYTKKGFESKQIESLFELGRTSGPPAKVISKLEELKLDVSSLAELKDSLSHRGVSNFEFNLGVVRGIDYYTGIVFEVYDGDHPDLGSLAGGGRYDLLPKTFGRDDLSATGAAGGMERIALSLAGKGGPKRSLVYVAFAGPSAWKHALGIQRQLREEGIQTDASFQERPLSKQLEDASRMGASWAVIIGEKEISARKVTLRDMSSRGEEALTLASAVKRILGS